MVIRIRKSKDRQHNGQKKKNQRDKQRSAKRYAESLRSSNTNPIEVFIIDYNWNMSNNS